MSRIDKSVSYYTKGQAVITVSFPEDRVTCQWCPYLISQSDNKRHKCFITGELLVYPFITRGMQCPIVLNVKEE